MRAHGLRLTGARRLVLEALFAIDRPVSADEIAGGLGGVQPASDLASVYRNLETLERLGLIRHLHFGHGASLYELTRAEPSVYGLCERCQAVTAARRASSTPTANLDPRARRELLRVLDRIDCTMLVVTHDLPFAAELCERAVILSAGRIAADGPCAAILADDELLARHDLELPAGFDPARLRAASV